VGQQRRSKVARTLVRFTPKSRHADRQHILRLGAKKATSAHLFDHLVGAGNEVLCQGKTDCSGGLEVD